MNKYNPSSTRQNTLREWDYLKNLYQTPAETYTSRTSTGDRVKKAYEDAAELRRKRAERLAIERAEAENEKRRKEEQDNLRKRNLEISRKEWDEKVAKQKKQEQQDEEYIDKQKDAADKQYEKDYQDWANKGGGIINWRKFPLGRAVWEINNEIGSAVVSSIDVNGLAITGKMSMNELTKQAANAHKQYMDYANNLKTIEDQEKLFIETSRIPTQDRPGLTLDYVNTHRNDPFVVDYLAKIKDFSNAKAAVRAKMEAPEIKGLNDAYKQIFVNSKKGTFARVADAAKILFQDATTYKGQMPKLAQERKQALDAEYDDLVNTPSMETPKGLTYDQILQKDRDLSKTLDAKWAENVRQNLPTAKAVAKETRQKRDLKYADDMIATAESDNQALAEEYKDNRTHLAESKEYWGVAKGFKMNTQAHQYDALWNPLYWRYNLAPMVGSSLSSPDQAIATGIKTAATVAGLAAAPFSDGASLGIMQAGEVLATPFEWKGAMDENYGEIWEKRVENIQGMLKDTDFTGDTNPEKSSTYNNVINELKKRSAKYWRENGWSEEQIKEHVYGDEGDKHVIQDYIAGITSGVAKDKNGKDLFFGELLNPSFQKALIFSTAGLLAQFDADNMRTMGEIPFQKSMSLLPTKWLNGAFGSVKRSIANKATTLANKLEIDALGKIGVAEVKNATQATAEKAAEATYKNGFRRAERTMWQAAKHGYETGAAAGDMLGFGFAGHTIGGTIGAAAESGMHAAMKLSPTMQRAAEAFADKAMMKYQGVIDRLTPDKAWQKTLLKYGLNMGKRFTATGFSEGAEEAAQYLNSKKDWSEYGWGGLTLSEMISNDLQQGGRILNAYMSLFGITNSELKDDQEFWSNLKGGFALGGIGVDPMNVIQVGGNLVHGYKEYSTANYIMTNGVMDREYNNINRAANADVARLALMNKESYVMDYLDAMEDADRRRENPNFSQEWYDQRRRDIQSVMALAKNNSIRQMLEAKGIKYGTDRYTTAIADIYNLLDQLLDNKDQSKEKNQDLQKIYNSLEFQTESQKIVDDILSDTNFGDKQSFDEAVTSARNDAMIAEIDAIRSELNLDTNSKEYKRKINSPENQKRIQDAMDAAEQHTKQNLAVNMKWAVVDKTKLVNRLAALMGVKAKTNTVEDFYTFLHDKFGLKSQRPDAKTIEGNIDSQIKQTKHELARITADTADKFDESMSDQDVLNYLNSAQDIIRTNDSEAQELETAIALLNADRSVTQKYYNEFTEGLVKNKDGVWEYNPSYQKKQRERAAELLRLKTLGKDEEHDALKEQEVEYTPVDEKAVVNNKYGRRIDAIRQANERNQAISWAVNEVVNGDAVNKLEEVFAEEEKAEQQKEVKETQNNIDPFAPEETTKKSESDTTLDTTEEPEQSKWERTSEKRAKRFEKTKKQYLERKKRAKEVYEKNKKEYSTWKKSSMSGSIVPLDPIVKAANALMYAAKTTTYKFSQLVEDFAEIAEDININDAIPTLKKAYIKRYAYRALRGEDVDTLMSSPEEVGNYGFEQGTTPIEPDPQTIPVYQKMQEAFTNDSKNIVEELSSHFDILVDDGNSPKIYKNIEAIQHSQPSQLDKNPRLKQIVDDLKAANTSDESFERAIGELTKLIPTFPAKKYVEYRTVDGIEEAIGRKFLSWVPGQFVESGIKVRKAGIYVLLGREDELNPSEFPANLDQFIKDMRDVKNKIEGLGLTILDTEKYIYGTNNAGQDVASLADIIAADAKGKIYVIDIRSGYTSIRDRFTEPASKWISFTIEQQVTDQLKQIEQIINNKFKLPVKGLYCIPVIYNQYNENGIRIEFGKDGTALIHIKTMAPSTTTLDVDTYRNGASALVDKINSTIDEYNSFVEEAVKYTNEYSKLDHITVEQYSTADEYASYTDLLNSRYEDIQNRIEDLKQAISRSIASENIIWQERAQKENVQEIPYDVQARIDTLSNACSELDLMLDYIPDTKATTQIEKENVKKLYQVIFDAQKALDDLLQDPDASQVDVTKEEELIASAMERLIENKDNFGAMSVFMCKWWADNFVTGSRTNTEQQVQNPAEQSAMFVNTIRTWMNTLYSHVVTDLDNHPALQEWYSSILNRYFSKLLDNAQEFAKGKGQSYETAMGNLVAKGRKLIEDFNDTWGSAPDEDFPGPPQNDVERINRLPVRWKDLYNYSTSHSPAFDAMANSTIYYVMSSNPTFVSSYKTQSSPAENPDDKSTRFILFKDELGEVKLRINWWCKDPWFDKKENRWHNEKEWKYVELPFQIDILNYPDPTQDDINRFTVVNRANKKFTNKVSQMLDYIEKHPECELTFTVSADKGSINYDNTGDTHSVEEFLFAGPNNKHDLYTISISPEDNMGVCAFIIDPSTNTTNYIIRTGKNINSVLGSFDNTYDKQHLQVKSGTIVYLYSYGQGERIGVPIQSGLIGNESAQKLVDLIYRYVSGERQVDGYDIVGLLKQRLYIYDPTKFRSKYSDVSNMVTINQNGDITIGKNKINVFTNRQQLVEKIASMNNATPVEIMSDNMASSNDEVLKSARSQFAYNQNLDKITLPNGFVLTRDDFTHQNSNGTQGSTWLGYLLRNGLLKTRATSKGYRQVNIDNLSLVDKSAPVQIGQQKPAAESRRVGRRNRPSSLSKMDDPFMNAKGGLTMTVNELELDMDRTTDQKNDFESAVREYFKNVFGNDFDLLFEDTKESFIKHAAKNQRTVGLCTSEMIKLSLYAPYTAMYHEAFHKIMELVLPDAQREQFYKMYRSAHGKNMSERSVAEGLADMFVDYMTKKVEAKNAKGFGKIFKWFKCFGFALNMLYNYGIKNTWNMYTVYHNMNSGKYANSDISESKAKRFREEFNNVLYYPVNGVNFSHIADSGQLQEMVKALSFYILDSYDIQDIDPDLSNIKIDEFVANRIPQDVIDDLTGKDIPAEELTAVDLAFREVFKKGDMVPIIAEKGKAKGKTIGYRQTYPNFNALKPYIADYISSIVGEYNGKIDDEFDENEVDDGENRNTNALNIDRFDKASFEFSKLESVNKKVKLFFATIPYCTFDENGRITLDYSMNIYECPTFMPLEQTYNILTNEKYGLSTSENINDLDKRLEKLALHDPMARNVYNKYHELISDIYKYDADGNITSINYENEAFAIQILNAIRSQNIDFVVALSNTNQDGSKQVRIASSSLDRDSILFPNQWSSFLLSGQVGPFKRARNSEGKLVFKEGQENTFNDVAQFIGQVIKGLSQSNEEFVGGGETYVKDSLENIALLKQDLIQQLHNIGIIFSAKALDHMLLTEYGSMGADGMLNWLMQTGNTSINNFIDTLTRFAPNGKPNDTLLNEGYSNIGFVKNLAKWQGVYNRITTQQMALGLNGKRLYAVSQNSSISHIINMLNTENLDNETIRTLLKFGYNLYNNGIPQGSIILKAIAQKKEQFIQAHTYIGFKTDNRGDSGSEYTEEATVEDYIAKMTMLQSGYLIFPTLADKGTWVILSGVEVPGITFNKVKKVVNDETVEETSVQNGPTIQYIGGEFYIIPSNAVVDQMLEYANTERLAIQQCMEDLGYDEIPGYEKQGRTKLPDAAKIKNYHTPNKDKKTKKIIEPNGTRFLSLTKIAVKELVGKEWVVKEYNLNDPNKSSVELLSLANEKFFSKSLEEQREIMALTLAIQNRHEVLKAIDLGIVESSQFEETWTTKSGQVVNGKATQKFATLQSKYLDNDKLDALTSYIMRTMPHRDYGTWAKIPAGRESSFKSRIARSLAIAALLGDTTNRAIISSQEVMRCFSGHPALFKVDYAVDKGTIRDSAYDIQKRIGGMISTGDDNVLNLPGISSTYTCAECSDYEVSSASDVASRLKDMFIRTNAQDVFSSAVIRFANKRPEKFVQWVYENEPNVADNLFLALPENPTEKDIKEALSNRLISVDDAADYIAYNYSYNSDKAKKLPQDIQKAVAKAEEDGEKFASSYDDGINVADGASYITDQMCENMLRMRGAYDANVKKAFDILRSDDKYSWLDKRDAYKTVYDAVNIVTTKYTAYGFRDHTLNGDQVSDIAVAYYNKFALFPLFPCIATGKMHGIYTKMINEGVDMLLMTSAVKVGSQGAVEFDGNSISQPFNKYTQSYAYLRRQLNTDPEEGDKIPMGTQMVKIGLLNLRLGRTNYIDARSGKLKTGQEILDSFMGSIKQLAINGAQDLHKMFFYDGTTQIDPEKLSEYLKSQLSSRNANKGIIEAIQVTKDPQTGLKKLVCPLAATSDAAWIESILISTVNRRVIDIVTPGSSFVQRSVFAIEGEAGEGAIKSDANMPANINGGKKLQMLNEDGSMDAVISMDYFDEVLFKGKLRNMSFNEKRQWLIDNGIIGPNAKANTIGYRIPTQAQSSIHALRFVDVISAVKSTIILPEEFTKITGSDFDIDHLYLASYNYNVQISEDGVQYATTTFDPQDQDGKYNTQYHQNNIIDCLMTLLKDSENSMNSLYKSIDNDTDLITSIAKKVPETGSTKDEPFNFGTLHEQVDRKNDYITGKTGIGPFALNVTNQVLTRLYGVKFKDTKFTKDTGILRLDNVIDDNDNAIQAWLSAFINAHVDIVKDPYISKLNVNQFTYNTLNLLIRSGFSDFSVWFVAQPVIRDMAQASNLAKSQYSRDLDNTPSTFAATEAAIHKALLKYMSDEELAPSVIERYTHSTNKRDIDVRINTINYLKQHENVLAEIVKHPEATKVTVDNVTYDVKDMQKLVFYAWKTLEKYSIALGDLVQHTKIDTRKHGKSLIAINQYLDAYNKLFDDNPRTSIWDMDSLHNLAQNSWIDLKTKLAIAIPSLILSTQTFNANPEFLKAVIDFGNILSTTGGVLNTDTLNFISRSLQTAIKSEYIVKYARQKLNMSNEDIAGLFIGPNSINNWLTMLKSAIENKPEFARLKNNHLLNQIYSKPQENPTFAKGKMCEKPAFVTILDNVDDSRVNSDLLIDGWTDLFNDPHPNVRLFARKLVVYAFLTSGEFKGWNKMFKLVPPAWIRGEIDTDFQSFSDYVQKALTMSSTDYYKYFDQIVENNFMDYRLSKRVKQTDEDGSQNFVNIRTGKGTIIAKIGKLVSMSQINQVEKYITVRDDSYTGKGVAGYDLFKLAAFKSEGEEGIYPIYVKMKKRGYHQNKVFDIYEYGWDFGYGENEIEAMTKFDFEEAYKRVHDYVSSSIIDIESDERVQRAIVNNFFGLTEKPVVLNFEQRIQRAKNLTNSKIQLSPHTWTRDDAAKWEKVLLIFTDNTDRTSGSGEIDPNSWYAKTYGEGLKYPTQTAAIVRGLDNARPISTQRWYHEGAKGSTGRWNDSDFEEFKKVIDAEFDEILREWNTGKYERIWLPSTGIFNTKISNISKLRTPLLYNYLLNKMLDLFETVNKDLLKPSQTDIPTTRTERQSDSLPGSNVKMNIWWGKGENDPQHENGDLSNFAERPVSIESPFNFGWATYKNVEAAFQASKLRFADIDNDTRIDFEERLSKADGPTARKIGKTIPGLDREKWDANSSSIMKTILKLSFVANPGALQKLLATGNAILTHTQDKGKWGTEFPRLLMQVREELRDFKNNTALNEAANSKEHENC